MNKQAPRNGRTAGTPATADQLEQLAREFVLSYGQRLLAAAELMRANGVTTICPQNWKTGSAGLERFEKYVVAVEQEAKLAAGPKVRKVFEEEPTGRPARR